MNKDMNNKELFELRMAAILVWHYWSPDAKAASEATEAEQKRRIESFHSALQKIVGSNFDIVVTINGGCLEAIIEDLQFVAYEFIPPGTKEPMTLVTLLGRCPDCGTETMSEPVFNLAGLGQRLEKFEPIRSHSCRFRSHYSLSKSLPE